MCDSGNDAKGITGRTVAASVTAVTALVLGASVPVLSADDAPI